jgi:CRISPR system Cascade subunit CasE
VSYLTQVTLDFASAARMRLRDSYDWHQAAWKAFPGRDAEPRDFLTRLDSRREGFRLLIVSPMGPVRPDWCTPDPESFKTRPIPETYFRRRRYEFQLCANPTKKVSKLNPDGSLTKNGRRVPLSTRDELVAWLRRKGEQGGFSIEEGKLRTFPRGRDYFEKNGQRGMHSAVEFDGVLTVSETTKFYETFTRGIGSAKAFGFGLLVIAPAL